MEQKRKRSAEEIQQLLDDHKKSGLTRQQYCQQQGIPLTTLAYYRRIQNKQRSPRFVKVLVKTPVVETSSRFTLVLGNGRRVECDWSFGDGALVRLIRIVEAA